MQNNNEQTIKVRAKRDRNSLRMRYDEVLTLIEEASCELNDSQVLKVMKLVFGLTQFMSPDHAYHEDQWGCIARSLKLHTAGELLGLVQDAHLFIIEGVEGKRMFYFPDYKRFHDKCDAMITRFTREQERKEDERSANPSTESSTSPSTNSTTENSANSQIANEETSPHACVGTGNGILVDNFIEKLSTKEKELDAALSTCMARLWQTEGPDGLLHSVRKQLLELLSLSEEEKDLCKFAYGHLVHVTLVKHFERQRYVRDKPRDLLAMKPDGQDAWVKGLFGSKYMPQLIRSAADEVRPLLAKAISARSIQHPNGEFEWLDLTDSCRYYDDPTEGALEIPADVPPRPSATARLHPTKNIWL